MKTKSLPAFANLFLLSSLTFLLLNSVNPTCNSAEPPRDWLLATTEEVGMDSAPLAEMFDFIRSREIQVHSIQIVRHGRLALDAYFYPYSDTMRHDVASATKSITSTLIGLALDKGLLPSVREPVLSFFPERVPAHLDSRKQSLNLEHLLTMQAGWDCGFEPNEARLFEMRRSHDWAQFMLDLPMVADPGNRWAYCSGNCHLLSIILTQAAKTNALAFARLELFGPLGIDNIFWTSDPKGHNHGWGDLQLHPRDMAKIGQFFLQRGRWGARQILSEQWISAATRAHVDRTINEDHYGYYWWVKGQKFPGMFEAVGRGGQRINIWPAKDLVLVFTGGGFEPGDIAPFILKALQSDKPLPANPSALATLQAKLLAARKPPAPKPIAKLPVIAARISEATFSFSTNSLQLNSLALHFSEPSQALAKLTWAGHPMNIPIGLDSVERFSPNRLIDLPQAVKGEWLDGQTFQLRLNLIGGINQYRIKLTFSPDAQKVDVELSERTGLNHESFNGVQSKSGK